MPQPCEVAGLYIDAEGLKPCFPNNEGDGSEIAHRVAVPNWRGRGLQNLYARLVREGIMRDIATIYELSRVVIPGLASGNYLCLNACV